MNWNARKFTYAEATIIVAVVIVLISIAIPPYYYYLNKIHRDHVMKTLISLQTAQENYKKVNAKYANLDELQKYIGKRIRNSHYAIAVVDANINEFTITATAKGAQAYDTENGTSCSTLTLHVERGAVLQMPPICWHADQ